MLLETLDIKKDDIVIYSQNLFNHDKNFRIVFKDDVNKESHKISYGEVCRYVNEYTPKNLIVYRLLTNIKGFEIYVPKYGFFLNINGITEMIFFDPVYAVRELEEYSQSIDYNQLRFRIQQVGLTTLNRKGDLPNYAEIYSIDLEATEAKFQNDKVFADAIFSTNKVLKPKNRVPNSVNKPSVKGTEKPVETKDIQQKDYKKINDAAPVEKLNVNTEPGKDISGQENINKKNPDAFQKRGKEQTEKQHSVVKIEQNITPPKNESTPDKQNVILPDKEIIHGNKPVNGITSAGKQVEGIRIVRHDISEDKNFDYKEIMRINFKGAAGLDDKDLVLRPLTDRQDISHDGESKNITPGLNKVEEKAKSSFGKFLEESKSNKNNKEINRQPGDEKVSQVLNMFKYSSSSNEYLKERADKQIVLKLDNK